VLEKAVDYAWHLSFPMAATKAIEQVAKLIAGADALVFTTGAGMGVASGLGTFRGKAAGVWPPLKKLGIDFTEMSNPKWFDKPLGKSSESANFAWAFWHFRFRAYTANPPHKGYTLLKNWAAKKKLGAFSFTSNIDGHWKACGFPDDRVIEVHGNVRFFQCAKPRSAVCEEAIWPIDALDLKIDETTDCAEEPLPKCKHCGHMARPNVLMFGDWGFISRRYDKQEANYLSWLKKLSEAHAKIVVIEIGAGTAVPTVRLESEKLAGLLGASLVRINPDAPKIPLSVMMNGQQHFSFTDDSLALLEQIDSLLPKLDPAFAVAAASPAEESKAGLPAAAPSPEERKD